MSAKNMRLRKLTLDILQANHDQQATRHDSSMLWSAVVRMGFDASRNDVMTILQDLCDRGYVRYVEMRNNRTGEIWLVKIELTSRGRDLQEGTIHDPAVGE
jgi:hypothetical protein